MNGMKIQEYQLWDKHTFDLIGYVDFGDAELNYALLTKMHRYCYTCFCNDSCFESLDD